MYTYWIYDFWFSDFYQYTIGTMTTNYLLCLQTPMAINVWVHTRNKLRQWQEVCPEYDIQQGSNADENQFE